MKREYEMKVVKKEEKTVTSKNVVEETVFVLKCEQTKGIAKVSFSDDAPFDGLNYGDSVSIVLKNNQTTLKENGKK